MNFFNKNRTIFWILIFLVLVNLSILGGYLFFMSNSQNKSQSGTHGGKGWALKKELSLTPDQTLKVQQINAEYKASSEPLIVNIQATKAGLLEELSKENTDTAIVSKLAEIVNTEQKELQMANIHQFLDLKKVCTPEQTIILSQIYSELYGGNLEGKGNGQGKGKGKGKGMMHRYRRGQSDTVQNRN